MLINKQDGGFAVGLYLSKLGIRVRKFATRKKIHYFLRLSGSDLLHMWLFDSDHDYRSKTDIAILGMYITISLALLR